MNVLVPRVCVGLKPWLQQPAVEGFREHKMGEEKQRSSIPALPWMRDPVDVTLCPQLPLDSVPSLHPKYITNYTYSSLFPSFQFQFQFQFILSLI